MTLDSQGHHRRFAVGDIHGCSRTLRRLVEEVLCLRRIDTLYLLGDYIDRGPDSKGVLDYLMSLCDAGYSLCPLLGNHEAMLLEALKDPVVRKVWFGNGGWGTLQEFGVDTPEAIPAQYIEFLKALPPIMVIHDYIFVHAGLDFDTADPILDTSINFMLWERNWRLQPSKLGGRTLVHGHTVTPFFEIHDASKYGKSTICLDNGCFSKGQIGHGTLVALDLDTRELLVQPNCEL